MTDQSQSLTRYAWLSIGVALATIALKTSAWLLTGSVGLLSDAAESVVNLVAGFVALIALKVASLPPDERFPFGRGKAEYFSAAIEGVMIFLAATVIIVSSVARFLNPQPLENIGVGLVISVIASALNGFVAVILIRAGRRFRSPTLNADGKHLMTDVVTSAGVVLGVLLVWITRWDRLDAIVAFAVGVNITITGLKLITESANGLLDAALPADEQETLVKVLERRESTHQVKFHGLQARVAGRNRFATLHVLLPAECTIRAGHDYIEGLEEELREAVPGLLVYTHLEPLHDPKSYHDMAPDEVPLLGPPLAPPETRANPPG